MAIQAWAKLLIQTASHQEESLLCMSSLACCSCPALTWSKLHHPPISQYCHATIKHQLI